MTSPIKQVSFSAGEISPYLYARPDLVKYETGLRTCRNYLPLRQGGVSQRPGTMYVGTTLNGGAAVRLIPFIFNETGTGQSYVLEFGDGYVTFYQDGAPVVVSSASAWSSLTAYVIGDYVTYNSVIYYAIAAGTNHQPDVSPTFWRAQTQYQIVSPFTQAMLATIQYAQSADVLTLVEQSVVPKELRRSAATSWAFSDVQFDYVNVTAPTLTASGTARASAVPYWQYGVTGIDESGAESITPIATTGALASSQIVPASSTDPVTITISGGSANYWRIYKREVYNFAAPPSTGPYGFVQELPGTVGTWVDTVTPPDFTQFLPIKNLPLVTSDMKPAAVGFVQQRRVFANIPSNPIGFWMSRTGNFSYFYLRSPTTDDDSISGNIFSDQVNAIQHILESKFAIFLTAGAELYVQGDGLGVITPSSVNASVQSTYGASNLRPIKAGEVILFNQALGSFVRDLGYDFASDGYRGNDITVFSSHLFETYQLVDMTYQKIPDSVMWAVRDDGVLLSCTYVREQQVLAWARHDFENGTVENVCAIPENGNYALYLSIAREIDGSTVRYIERLSSRLWSDQLNATYLDSFSSYNGVNTGSTTMTLTAVTPPFKTEDDNDAYQQHLTLTASASFFDSSMVGNQIFLNDAEWEETQGESGNQIRCTIITYSSPTEVVVTPDRFVPTDLQNTAITTWARAVKTVTGLDYLEGEDVSIWADRGVVGSPLNNQIDPVYTVESGSITLDKCYAVIYVGLPMTADFETLDIETSFGESMITSRKRTNQLGIYMYKTKTFFAGSQNPDTNLDNTDDDPLFQLDEQSQGTYRTNYDQPWPTRTVQDFVLFDAQWNKNGRMFIRNVDPAPSTILAVSPMGETSTDTPYRKA